VFVQRVVVDVGVPTGKYSDARPVNFGNHFVVVNPYYLFRTCENSQSTVLPVKQNVSWGLINRV